MLKLKAIDVEQVRQGLIEIIEMLFIILPKLVWVAFNIDL
jgi:hypothetical protein